MKTLSANLNGTSPANGAHGFSLSSMGSGGDPAGKKSPFASHMSPVEWVSETKEARRDLNAIDASPTSPSPLLSHDGRAL